MGLDRFNIVMAPKFPGDMSSPYEKEDLPKDWWQCSRCGWVMPKIESVIEGIENDLCWTCLVHGIEERYFAIQEKVEKMSIFD